MKQGVQRNKSTTYLWAISVLIIAGGVIYRAVQYGPGALSLVLPVLGLIGGGGALALVAMSKTGRRDVHLLTEYLRKLDGQGVRFVFRKNKETRDALEKLVPGSRLRWDSWNRYGAVAISSAGITVWDGGLNPKTVATLEPALLTKVSEYWLDEQTTRLRALKLAIATTGRPVHIPFGTVELRSEKVEAFDDEGFARLCESLRQIQPVF